jgi:two-component system, OmpR family, response regulator CssR
MTPTPHTILIVEDDPATRKLLSIVLEREGLNVVALESVPEAFDWLEHTCPNLAVLDVNLPGGTGFEIVQRIQDRYGSNPIPPVVFVLSGLRQEHNVLHGLRLGVAEYLTKPFSPLELVARLRRHMPDLHVVVAAEAEPGSAAKAISEQEFELELEPNETLEPNQHQLTEHELAQLELTPQEVAKLERAEKERS